MLIASPYNTTYGSIINSEKLIKSLSMYLAGNSDKNLNYEYTSRNDTELVFITGYNQDEKELPLWEHPIVLKDHKGRDVVATDLRRYIKLNSQDQPININDIIKDKSNINFIILRTLLTADFVAGEYGNFRNYFKNITTGFSLVISNMINMLVSLSPTEKISIEIVLAHYANLLFTDTKEPQELIPAIVGRITASRLSIPITQRTVETVVAGLNHNVKTINDLIDNIKKVLPPEKSGIVNVDILVNSLSNIWYGPGSSETIIMSIEHMPTWIALMYTNMADNTFKRTRLATMLDRSKNNIKPADFIKGTELYLKEHTL